MKCSVGHVDVECGGGSIVIIPHYEFMHASHCLVSAVKMKERKKEKKKRKRSNILLLRFYKLSPSLSLLIRNRRGFGDKFPVDTRTHIAHTKTAFLTSKYLMIPDLIRQNISRPSWQQAPRARTWRQPFRTDSFICHTINSKTPSSSHHCSTGSFTNLDPQNPSVDISELYKVCRSPDFEALKL